MIGIHPVHRRLAELNTINRKRVLTPAELTEVAQCLHINADIVRRLDELKQLSLIAYEVNDMEWQMEICSKIDAIEVKMM